MIRALVTCALGGALALGAQIQRQPAFPDEAAANAIRQKYLDLARGWAEAAGLTAAERAAMERGRALEQEMTSGLDDPLSRRILAAGEPSYEALAAVYPGKVLDRTLLGSYSDPTGPLRDPDNEFVIWWNGALSWQLVEGRQRAGMRPIATNSNLVVRVGPGRELLGRDADRFSRIAYEDGYLPIVRARYDCDGVRYEETAFAVRPSGAPADVAHVRLTARNLGTEPRRAELELELVRIDGDPARADGTALRTAGGALLLATSDAAVAFDAPRQRLTHRLELQPGQERSLYYEIPYWPGMDGARPAASRSSFEASHAATRRFWVDLLGRGMRIEVPEPRVNDVWRALLLQNFVLADGPRFTYGAGLWYNSSYFPVENGLGGNDFAFYGHGEYATALLPQALDVSVFPDKAGRKYQNRRAVVMHHLLQNWKLTHSTSVFERYRSELYRVADEIIADRRKTMVEQEGKRPLHWGLLPPDRPGVDELGGTYTMYVVAHNITNCQGLQDLGTLLVRTGADPARGERYLAEAREYRKTLLAAMEASTIRTPHRPPFVPLETLYFRDTPDYGPEPYDDLARGRVQATYYHYWADMELGYNFLDPDDAVARAITDYLEAMGGFVLGQTRGRNRPGQPFGWVNNVYQSGYFDFMLRAGRIDRFLLGFYGRLAFGMTRQVYVASEGSPFIGYNTTLGGWVSPEYSFPNSAANSETLRMLRNLLVHEELADNIETGDIWLMRGAPKAWLADGRRVRVSGAPTFFGPLSYEVESQLGRGLLKARVTAPARDPYRAIVLWLRVPDGRVLSSVTVNGRSHAGFDAGAGSIRLAGAPREFLVEARYK